MIVQVGNKIFFSNFLEARSSDRHVLVTAGSTLIAVQLGKPRAQVCFQCSCPTWKEGSCFLIAMCVEGVFFCVAGPYFFCAGRFSCVDGNKTMTETDAHTHTHRVI